MDFTHQPVLQGETLQWLSPQEGALVVDGTVGGGGHAEAILRRTSPGGRLIGLDVDPQAVTAARERLRPFGDRVRVVHASFRNLDAVLVALGESDVDGVLLDLGVSSPQLDDAKRGFRFAADTAETTPLDMRMDPGAPATSADLLRTASPRELETWFRDYADLPGARRLARSIAEARERSPLATARDLLDVIRSAGVGRGRRHHPATLVFQALRIAVNDELRALTEGLEHATGALRPGGRLVVIAYHSAEDRIAKRHFQREARGCVCPPELPVCACGRSVRLRILTRRPVRPGDDEVRDNPRARSARLRAAERVAEAA